MFAMVAVFSSALTQLDSSPPRGRVSALARTADKKQLNHIPEKYRPQSHAVDQTRDLSRDNIAQVKLKIIEFLGRELEMMTVCCPMWSREKNTSICHGSYH